MENPESYIQILSISKTHGLDGYVRASAFYPIKSELPIGQPIFIQQGASYIPYFISGFRTLGEDNFLILFEDLTNRNAAETLSRKVAFMPASEAVKFFDLTDETPFECLSYLVKEQSGLCLGNITEFVEGPGQDLVVIIGQYGEILMPWHPDWIMDLDDDEKIVLVELPEGFLDIYLSQ